MDETIKLALDQIIGFMVTCMGANANTQSIELEPASALFACLQYMLRASGNPPY